MAAVLAPGVLCAQGSRAKTQVSADPPALVADLSEHLVGITTGFSGAKVLLFGAIDGKGDVVVTVQGPVRAQIVRRRERVLGVWVSVASAEVTAPVFYHVASSRPLDEIASPALQAQLQASPARLDIAVGRKDGKANDDDYRNALIRLNEQTHLYENDPGWVSIIGGRLFRTEMILPANVPTGSYDVNVFLVRDGRVVNRQTNRLVVGKSGVSADISHFAKTQAPLYGLAAITVAALAGWLAAAAFRRA